MRLEILDRIALSTRQWVCILRVDEKRVVVGVSGDTMTSLAVLDDASRDSRLGSGGGSVEGGQGLEVEGYRREDDRAGWGAGPVRGVSSRESMRRDEGTFWFRPGSGAREGGAPAGSGGDVPWENHLAPYRREVNRLRAMLQNWSRTTEREEAGQKDGGEDQSK
jgi:hypothetical protein